MSIEEIANASIDKVGAKAKNIAKSCKILQNISNVHIPQSVVVTVEEAFEFGADIKIRQSIVEKLMDYFKKQPIIVRSSSVFEDSKMFSAAGQYESFMNRRTATEIEQAILMVCDSAVSDSAKLYNDIYLDDSFIAINNMAVLCQEMIPCDYSGVLYTSNPLCPKGKKEHLIELNKGLGDKVASGENSSTTYHFPHNLGKECNYPILSDYSKISDNIKVLCKSAEILVNSMNVDLDIEWGIFQDELYIFQVRPMFFCKSRTLYNLNSFDDNVGDVSKGNPISNGIMVGRYSRNGIFHKDNFKQVSISDIITAQAIVVTKGGLLSHSASISRELGVPAIICNPLKQDKGFVAMNAYSGTIAPWDKLNTYKKSIYLWETFYHLCNYTNTAVLKTKGIETVECKSEAEAMIQMEKFAIPPDYLSVFNETQYTTTYDIHDKGLIENNIIVRKQITDKYFRLQVKKLDLSNSQYRVDTELFFYFSTDENLSKFIEQFPLIKTGTQARTITHYSYDNCIINNICWKDQKKYSTISAETGDNLYQFCKKYGLDYLSLACKSGKDIFRELNIELDFKI